MGLCASYVHIRLAMTAILNAREDSYVAVFAVVCTSFTAVNVGTHKRSPLNPEGDVSLGYVRTGNLLLARKLGLQSNYVLTHLVKQNASCRSSEIRCLDEVQFIKGFCIGLIQFRV